MLADRQPSWTLQIGVRSDVRTALFLRDVLALSVPDDPFPPTDPWVPVLPAGEVDRQAVAAEWLGWFNGILDGAPLDSDDGRDPDSAWIAHWPNVRHALRTFIEPIKQWDGQLLRHDQRRGRHRDGAQLWVVDLVNDIGTELDRAVRPFHLVITELPVRGQFWMRRGYNQVLASPELIDNIAAFGWALRPVLRELA
ncbi:hypothetical protein GCM10010174_11390 [Kutzneria viridogrisea]|uniref:Uncharacterized protein n=2 Tax=Kutzneria TaxID=43356 RepID=W5WK75_9PSEU|nr:hypothetical protein [Kutzneria albida]AHI01258.1 hypothetical protein KALB_7900 [Kutzneria albida DSM 43870]